MKLTYLAALVVAAAFVAPAAAVAAPLARVTLARVNLPAPTGPHAVGTVSMRLVDTSRPDPLREPARPYRELMVSVFYPAEDAGRYPVAKQMLPGAAQAFDQLVSPVGPDVVDWAATVTHAHAGAPADRRSGSRPVVLYSPGVGDPRTWNTNQAEDLASRGYVVVTIDHTYDAAGVEFPCHRVERSVLPGRPFDDELIRTVVRARVADTRFVLDRLAAIGARVPGLAMDLGEIGMFGQSGGGTTALQAMWEDPRIKAAMDMDGQLSIGRDDTPGLPLLPVAATGVDRPFLLLGHEPGGHTTLPSWGALWAHSRGWHADLHLKDSAHASFTDAEALLPQLGRDVSEVIGTVDAKAAVADDRAYTAAFFDRFLRHRDDHLLDGPSAAHPEMEFVR